MDSLTGAAVAAVVAWLSIVAAAMLPVRDGFLRRMRGAGALSLAFVGLAALGAVVPGWVPLFVLAAGVAWAALTPSGPAPGS